MADEANEEFVEVEGEGYEDYEVVESANDDHFTEALTARERLREQLANEVAEFLARGGKINYIDSNLLNESPRKPPCGYGGQPL